MYTKKILNLLTNPSKGFDDEKKTRPNEALKYLITLSVVAALIAVIIAGIVISIDPSMLLLMPGGISTVAPGEFLTTTAAY